MNDVNKQVDEILHYEAVQKEKWNHIKPWDRHGLILMVVGIVYVLIGLSFVTSPTARLGQSTANIFPGNSWYLGFIITGAVAIMSSRWPNRPRTLGYAVLTGWSAASACLYIIAGMVDNLSSLVTQGIVWGMVAFLWWAISGLISPPNERGRYGVPSPHRDHCGSFDRRVIGDSHTTGSVESKPNHSN